MEDGYEFFASGRLMTVFSATNYCATNTNNGSMALVWIGDTGDVEVSVWSSSWEELSSLVLFFLLSFNQNVLPLRVRSLSNHVGGRFIPRASRRSP